MARSVIPTTSNTSRLHPRNPHQGRYDLQALTGSYPALTQFIRNNPNGEATVDFTDDQAVLCLNAALLAHYYQIKYWQIPAGYLCPPIPGRVDYIHYAADLLAKSNQQVIPQGRRVKVLDIGCGANCIYPIIGARTFGWQFIGTDIDKIAANSAKLIVQSNPSISKLVKIRLNPSAEDIFTNNIQPSDRFSLTLCNPPFHASQQEAESGSQRKWRNLNKQPKDAQKTHLNFGGQASELWCEGGELAFLTRMIQQSVAFNSQVCWFTSLVSKEKNLPQLKNQLQREGAVQVKVISMSQGQKTSRLLAWSFMDKMTQKEWAEMYWR
jgi:23S rRNA (adenine1618-N6)-methyltransferase